MQIGEFLVKLGAISDAKEVGKFANALQQTAKVATAATAVLNGAAAAAFAFFDGSIRKAEELAKTKNALYTISKKELEQANQYKASMTKLGSTFDIVKTKIALGFAPRMTEAVNRVNDFIVSNKALISEGITKVVDWLFKFADGVLNVFKSINQLITTTIGWKNALLAIGAVLLFVKRRMIMAFLANPVTLVIAAIAGLILLIDDLMTYMRGGESYFGKFWSKLDGWAKAAGTSLQEMIDYTMTAVKWIAYLSGGFVVLKGAITILKNVGGVIVWLGRLFMANPIIAAIALIASGAFLVWKNWDKLNKFFSDLWRKITSYFRDGLKSILKYFGMSEKSAEATVNAIGKVFGGIIDIITSPFRAAWKLVTDLFSILGDDTTTFTEKLGKTFSAVIDFIVAPFKAAFDKVKALFDWLMNGIKNGMDKLNNSELMKKVRENPELSPTGGMRRADFSMPPLKSMQAQQVSNTSSVNATINVNGVSDPVAAANQTVKSLNQQAASANRNIAGAGY